MSIKATPAGIGSPPPKINAGNHKFREVKSKNPTFDDCFCMLGTARMKRDGTYAETRFGLSAKQTSPFKLTGGVSSVDYWQPRCAHQR